MAKVTITIAAGLAALLLGIGVGWTAQQWQPSSPGSEQEAHARAQAATGSLGGP
jgi:hypothetical protein